MITYYPVNSFCIWNTKKYLYFLNTMTGLLWKKEKPLIGFEPMTYALPWRYSTTELKGLIWFNSRTSHYVNKISICTYIIYTSICSRLIVASRWFLNNQMDLPSKSRVKWIVSRPALISFLLLRWSLSKQNALVRHKRNFKIFHRIMWWRDSTCTLELKS